VRHTPSAQTCDEVQSEPVYASPRELQTLRRVIDAHTEEPGVQIRGMHAPPEQLSLIPQAVLVLVSPLAAQVETVDVVRQREVPGVHTKGKQTPD